MSGWKTRTRRDKGGQDIYDPETSFRDETQRRDKLKERKNMTVSLGGRKKKENKTVRLGYEGEKNPPILFKT